jgi:chemotaxis protein MotB
MYAVLRIDNQKLTQNTVENVTKYQVNQDLISFKKDELKKILKDNISDSDSVKLLNTPKGVIIRLNNKLLFDEGSAVIKKDSQKIINEIIKVLTKIDNPVIIEGHTDSIPIKNVKYSSNWELSTARATNIIAYISKIENISPKRLCAVGYGEYMPIADNTTISGRILNRRVDIIVLDK